MDAGGMTAAPVKRGGLPMGVAWSRGCVKDKGGTRDKDAQYHWYWVETKLQSGQIKERMASKASDYILSTSFKCWQKMKKA